MAIDSKAKRKSAATAVGRGHYQQPSASGSVLKRMTQAHRYGGNGAAEPDTENSGGVINAQIMERKTL